MSNNCYVLSDPKATKLKSNIEERAQLLENFYINLWGIFSSKMGDSVHEKNCPNVWATLFAQKSPQNRPNSEVSPNLVTLSKSLFSKLWWGG
jgi:hypothetical protein